ncbi:hypothetical protein HanRHA438_Chr06g0277851 [Helianthus annuus]|nr:hypothetical protein HanRHA438_Chr06g0277851 [Helianthus annuus]
MKANKVLWKFILSLKKNQNKIKEIDKSLETYLHNYKIKERKTPSRRVTHQYEL